MVHEPSLYEAPSDDEQSFLQGYSHGGSGQVTCVQYMMDSGTSQGVGGDTLVPCRGSGGRLGGTESGVSGANVHPEKKMQNNVNKLK